MFIINESEENNMKPQGNKYITFYEIKYISIHNVTTLSNGFKTKKDMKEYFRLLKKQTHVSWFKIVDTYECNWKKIKYVANN